MDGYINQINSIINQRIQSLAITLDKIKCVLTLIGTPYNNKPPLKFLTEKEKNECHWKSMKEYLKENFIKLKVNLKNAFLIEKISKNNNIFNSVYFLCY